MRSTPLRDIDSLKVILISLSGATPAESAAGEVAPALGGVRSSGPPGGGTETAHASA